MELYRALSSARMESTSMTVPSIVVYVTVPNREAGTFTYVLGLFDITVTFYHCH